MLPREEMGFLECMRRKVLGTTASIFFFWIFFFEDGLRYDTIWH
jgi:hypothetical protein